MPLSNTVMSNAAVASSSETLVACSTGTTPPQTTLDITLAEMREWRRLQLAKSFHGPPATEATNVLSAMQASRLARHGQVNYPTRSSPKYGRDDFLDTGTFWAGGYSSDSEDTMTDDMCAVCWDDGFTDACRCGGGARWEERVGEVGRRS